jgi:hypothetical protein
MAAAPLRAMLLAGAFVVLAHRVELDVAGGARRCGG